MKRYIFGKNQYWQSIPNIIQYEYGTQFPPHRKKNLVPAGATIRSQHHTPS